MSNQDHNNEARNIIGFYRGKDETIETILSDSAEIRSDRHAEVKGMGGLGFLFGSWNPHREARVVPLKVETPEVKSVSQSSDYQALPQKVKDVFDSGAILRTSPNEVSDFSALMYVTRSHIPEGRTGVLLYKGEPVIVNVDGKGFVVEVKGVGVANGNNNITDLQTRSSYFGQGRARWGGLEVAQGRREFRNLEILRNEKDLTFQDANSPRAALLVEYDGNLRYWGDDTDQSYLLRLAPASMRASFNGNDAFPHVENRANVTARGLAQQFVEMMSLDSSLIHTCAHAENLILTNDGYKFTDFSDMRTLAELADPHEITRRTFTEYIDEIPDRTEGDIEDYCRRLSKGLGIEWRDELKDTKVLAEEVWKSYVAPRTFEIRRNGYNGSREEAFREIAEMREFEDFLPLDEIDGKILVRARRYLQNRERDVERAEQQLADLAEWTPKFEAIQGDVDACRRFFESRYDHLHDDQLLGLARSEYERRVQAKPEVEERLAEYRKQLELSRKHIDNPREFAKFDPGVIPGIGTSLYYIQSHLEREIDLLETVGGETANQSLQVARSRIEQIKGLQKDTYGVIDRLHEDPNYLTKLAVLLY